MELTLKKKNPEQWERLVKHYESYSREELIEKTYRQAIDIDYLVSEVEEYMDAVGDCPEDNYNFYDLLLKYNLASDDMIERHHDKYEVGAFDFLVGCIKH